MRKQKYNKDTEWTDHYYPVDFYANASGIAKSFCAQHPEANKEAVYMAASNAAAEYEMSDKLRIHKFRLIIYIAIKTELYQTERKKPMPKLTNKEAEAFRQDWQNGMTTDELAKKYNITSSAVNIRIANFKKAAAAEECASAEVAGTTEETVQITERTERPEKKKLKYLELLDELRKFAYSNFDEHEVVTANASERDKFSEIEITCCSGETYRLKVERLE